MSGETIFNVKNTDSNPNVRNDCKRTRLPTLTSYTCKHCNRPFKTLDAFRRHLQAKHNVMFMENNL